LIIYPVSILQIISTLRNGYPVVTAFSDRVALGRLITDWCETYRRQSHL